MRLRATDSAQKELTLAFIHFVGKCDRCGRFHIKCDVSGMIFALTDEDEHRGCCPPIAFWLTSIERDENGHASAELHAVDQKAGVDTVNRRSL